jgi:hypothetical protein
MTDTFQVKCVNKSDRSDPHESILNIGGFDNGKAWKISIDTAIRGIESKKWSFYVSAGTHSVWVVVADYNGSKYLKSQTDDLFPDSLAGLPECSLIQGAR